MTPKVSIIMPAYNASKYIGIAIDSIISQTFKEWELIIADDCSTDKTVEIAENYNNKHNNIRLIKRTHNSGGARLPRKDAALAAQADLIMTFDADDFLDNDYIEKMYNRKNETNANIVLGVLHLCKENGEYNGTSIPRNDFDYSIVQTGKETAKQLLGEVTISVSGLLVDKDIYIKNITSKDKEQDNLAYVDEIDQRALLIGCDKVSFVNAGYYYRQHDASLMHLKDTRRYNFLKTLEAIYRFAQEHYNEEEVFNKLNKEFLTNLMFCYRDYYYYRHDKCKESKEILSTLEEAYQFARSKKMRPIGIKQILCLKSNATIKITSYLYANYLRMLKHS